MLKLKEKLSIIGFFCWKEGYNEQENKMKLINDSLRLFDLCAVFYRFLVDFGVLNLGFNVSQIQSFF